ncbi:MAG: polysaccharide deacetylase family protein [Bacteroidia bacterium]
MSKGKLVISLDFELMWGVRDHHNHHTYGEQIEAVHSTIPRMINLFDTYGVKATFSAVGMLFARDLQELESYIPDLKPSYAKFDLSPYPTYLKSNAVSEHERLHFAPTLIDQIKDSDHEIGTHSFSHYYCLEDGQTLEQFESDLKSAIAIAENKGIEVNSIVFPRNQFNQDYLEVCKRNNISSVRGTENSWLYEARNRQNESSLRRALRLLDAYINISGHHCHSIEETDDSIPINIPASRFLRPYSSALAFLEGLKLNRIKKSMKFAARNGLCYHLWWHPHNFSRNTEQNFKQLDQVLKYYLKLNQKYGMESLTMTDLSEQ